MKDYQTGLTAEEVRRRFRYVKSTGLFIRKVPVMGGFKGSAVQCPVGSVAGSLHKDGYVYIGINRRLYLAHRLAVLWVTGEWPDEEVDHKNGVRSDNRWLNLRQSSVQQNRMNTLGQMRRKGPYPGVYEVNRASGRHYVAQIKVNGEVLYLGSRRSEIAARQLRIAAERRHFGEFAGSLSRGQN